MQSGYTEQNSLWPETEGSPTRWNFNMAAQYCRAKGIECVLTYPEGGKPSFPFSIEQHPRLLESEIREDRQIIYVDSSLSEANRIYFLLSKVATIYFREARHTEELQRLWVAELLMGINPEAFLVCLEEIEGSNEPASWYQSTIGGKRLRAAYKAGQVLNIPPHVILQWASRKSQTLLKKIYTMPDEYPQFKEHPYDWLRNPSSIIPLIPSPKFSTSA